VVGQRVDPAAAGIGAVVNVAPDRSRSDEHVARLGEGGEEERRGREEGEPPAAGGRAGRRAASARRPHRGRRNETRAREGGDAITMTDGATILPSGDGPR